MSERCVRVMSLHHVLNSCSKETVGDPKSVNLLSKFEPILLNEGKNLVRIFSLKLCILLIYADRNSRGDRLYSSFRRGHE